MITGNTAPRGDMSYLLESPQERAIAVMDTLAQSGPPVVIDYPPTQKVFMGDARAESIDAGFRAMGVALTGAAERHAALGAVGYAYHPDDDYSEAQLVIRGRTRKRDNPEGTRLTIFLRPTINVADCPTRYRREAPAFAILGKNEKPRRPYREPKLTDDGRYITIDGMAIAIDEFYLLPRIESYSGAASQHQASWVATIGIANRVRALRDRPALPRVRLPQLVLPR